MVQGVVKMSHKGGIGVGEPRRRAGGFDYCVCLVCGHKVRHKRGVPCSEMKCPKCGGEMAGE